LNTEWIVTDEAISLRIACHLPPGEIVFILGLQDAIDGGVAQCDTGVEGAKSMG
jgi:hypothetical protein